ncbi:hypothetical protein GIB67_008568 [Kingdonia uniflora]|uniref:Uncharacterized protein n=1 Tax=Kingdonia uniflora TaxID=39325 RepID=A0A7J7N3V7_9MAGN|nr:hypothetical protein GIB67_008568 [Kingdonia uniflora]
MGLTRGSIPAVGLPHSSELHDIYNQSEHDKWRPIIGSIMPCSSELRKMINLQTHLGVSEPTHKVGFFCQMVATWTKEPC